MAATILGLVSQKLSTLIQGEFVLLWGVKDDMKTLSGKLQLIQAVLEDAEVKQISNNPIAIWLNKLKQAAYDADDVLVEWSTEANKSIITKVCESLLSCLCFKKILFELKVARKLKNIIDTFSQIETEIISLSLSPTLVTKPEFEKTSPTLLDEVVYGRDGDVEKVVEILLNNVNLEEPVSVLPIHGMGGLGKTTLARSVFHHKRVVEHFNARVWVCVGEDFVVTRVTKMIIDACMGQELTGKKFLLVLDDVWNEKREEWERVKCSFKCGAKGSSIIVTTRLDTVVSITRTPCLEPYPLTLLSEEHCWDLFKRWAFGAGNEETPELMEIGREIVRKCGGVPLAAKSLGGFLCLKTEVVEWKKVRDSQIWELEEGRVLRAALRLSYTHLPVHMRQCFSFCSIFPKDRVIKKKELIYLWMANGFIQPNPGMELEDVANLIFIELVRRSFFQDIEKDSYGDVYSCKMHDLIHDLACSVSVNECCIVEVGKATIVPEGVRHMSLVIKEEVMEELQNIQYIQSVIKTHSRLRTLLLLNVEEFSISEDFGISAIIFKTQKVLRALDMSYFGMPEMVAREIGEMKHLRYLNLFLNFYLRSLPGSISNLRNLQTLELGSCMFLEALPKHMGKMRSLRRVNLMGCDRISQMPSGMGQLTQLQTLDLFVVGPGIGRRIKELQGLNLRGELEIRGLDHVKDAEEAKEARLISKQNLSSLILKWGWDSEVDSGSQEKMIEGLRPHPNLKKLEIYTYGGSVFPTWIASLQSLVTIMFGYCKCESLPPLGQLPLLKALSLYEMPCLKRVGDELYGPRSVLPVFQSLEQLRILVMPNLEDWSSPCSSSNENPRQAFPVLKTLYIVDCPKLREFPSNPCDQNDDTT